MNSILQLRLVRGLSLVGVLVGTVFFAVSLSPSLLPRPFAVQGILSGVSFALGYGLGVAGLTLWNFLHLPVAGQRLAHVLALAGGALCLVVAFAFLWQWSTWQNTIREMMGMEEAVGLRPAIIVPIALAVFIVLLLLARLFRHLLRFLSQRLAAFVPSRVSFLVSIVVSVAVFWSAIDGVLINFLLRTADQSFQQLDLLIEDDLPPPTRAEQTGGPDSLVGWATLGRQGRRFVTGGPDAEALKSFFGAPLVAPIRVYVGLNSADTPQARVQLALDELKRVGAFERSVMVVATPTGSGWIDPAGQDPLEYLFRGDIATVAVQYSYLNSPLTLLTGGGYGEETARALFVAIYDHWRGLPVHSRPRLYLSGLSLGSFNSDLSFDLFDIIDDPFNGVLWVGPPFRNESWRRMTRDRNPGSPAWLPRFRDGAVVRFMNQGAAVEEPEQAWSGFRIVVLQYASDPITFFEPSAAWRAPDWLSKPRGPDVSPDLRWYPIVTMLQLAADMALGTAPRGFGHEYAPTDYISAWLALSDPQGWTAPEIERLRELFECSEVSAHGRCVLPD